MEEYLRKGLNVRLLSNLRFGTLKLNIDLLINLVMKEFVIVAT